MHNQWQIQIVKKVGEPLIHFQDERGILKFNNRQLLNEAEYRLKNYGDEEVQPRGITRSEILHNSSDDTKDKFNNCFVIHSK